MARKLEVEIVGDARSLQRALGHADSSSGKLGKTLGKALKAGALLGGAALVGLGIAAKRGFSEFVEAEAVMAQTKAGLQSTGGVAKVTARDITSLASSISKMSGIDDEAIQSSENLLLTFTKVRNEVGKGNKIFDEATLAVANMATKMNLGAIPSSEQLAASSIKIGKALNDPIKGVTALTKVGVQFTEQQKKSIKSMVEHGNIVGAQKVILKELETQFGGAAKAAGETLGGQMSKLKNRFDEFAGGVVSRVIPVLTGFANTVIPPVVDALSDVAGWLQDKIKPAIQAVVDVMPRIIEAFKKHRGTVADAVVALKDFKAQLGGLVSGNFAAVQSSTPALIRAFHNLAQSVQNLTPVFKAVFAVVFFPMVTFLKFTLPAAIQVFAFALDKLSGVVKAVSGVIGSFATRAGSAFASLANTVGPALNRTREVLNQFGAWVAGLPSRFYEAAKGIGSAIGRGIIDGISGLAGAIRSAAVNAVTGALSAAKNALKIGSPSLVFAQQVGAPISEGIAKGITEGAPRVSAALRGVLMAALRQKNFGNVSSIINSLFAQKQAGQKTGSEKRISAIESRRAVEDLNQAVSDTEASLAAAQAALAQAISEGDPAAIAAAQAVVAAETRAAARAKEDVTLYNLRLKAEAERAKLEAAQYVAQLKLAARLESLQKLFDKNHVTVGTLLNAVRRILRSLKIPGFAGGVTNYRGGLALVGERGPELVNLPRGSDVIPNGRGVGGRPMIVNLQMDGRTMASLLVNPLRNEVQQLRKAGGAF